MKPKVEIGCVYIGILLFSATYVLGHVAVAIVNTL